VVAGGCEGYKGNSRPLTLVSMAGMAVKYEVNPVRSPHNESGKKTNNKATSKMETSNGVNGKISYMNII